MDAEGDVITPQGTRTIKGFQETLGKVNDLLKLEKMVKDGDKSAETPLFIAKVKFARYNLVEATAKRKKLPSESKAQKTEIDKLFIGLEVDAVLSKVSRRDPASIVEAGGKLIAMEKAGRVPEGRKAADFWAVIMSYAEKKEDLALMEKAFEKVKSAVGDQINKRWVRRTESRIERLREKVKDKE
ncbi:MAG: hypothetical protein ACYTF5_02700, partial [Planctomycetota bacterium]